MSDNNSAIAEGVKVSNFLIRPDQEKKTFQTKVGRFTFRWLRPTERVIVEGRVSAMLGNAPEESVPQDARILARAILILDYATESSPDEWTSFGDYADEELTVDLYSKYFNWMEEVKKEVRKTIESSSK